ncbi:MAG: hypothetical protein HQL91_13930 [Magnetococcales bacterium]|nr:hypothetical protein [Magnetococcales bacterium]
MPVQTHITDPGTGSTGRVSADGALHTCQTIAPCPAVGTANKTKFLNGLLGSAGFESGVVRHNVNGAVTPQTAYIEAAQEYDIHILAVSFLFSDASVALNRMGALTLTNGINLLAEQDGDVTYLVKNATTAGLLLAQTGGINLNGGGADIGQLTNWSGTSDAQLAYMDLGAILGPDGLRIGRGTKDRLLLQIRDDLTGLEEFAVRVFGFRKYP